MPSSGWSILEAIYTHTAHGGKYRPEFVVEICNSKGEVVARVERTLCVRRKDQPGTGWPPPSR